MPDLLAIGVSGLRVSQTALAVTGNNITNTDTPGYTRQQAMQDSNNSQQLGATYLGSGASITDVRRIYSGYLTTQVRTATALDSDAQTYLTEINQVNSLLADSTTGITAVMENFFGHLKTEMYYGAEFTSTDELITEICDYIHWYNTERISLQREGLSPVQYRAQTLAA